jgi:hypothetical protein
LVGNCTDVPGPECRKGESLSEDEDDWSSGCYVPKDDTNNDDNDDKKKNDEKDDDDGDGDDDDDDDDEFLSLPVSKYFGHLDTWLCGHGWRRRENAENSEEQNLLRIFGSVSRELFKLLVPIYGSRGNFVCRHDDDDEQLPRFGFAGGSCSNCAGWKNKREKFGNKEKTVARLLEKAVFETSLEFVEEGGLVAALRPSVVAALKKRAGRFVGVFLGDRRDCFPCRSRRVSKLVLLAQLDVLKNCKIGCSELLLQSSGGRPATTTKRKLVFYSESEDDDDDDENKAADRKK